MAFTGLELPNITDEKLDDKQERQKIMEYLYQLTEQLRYMLTNLDEDNLSESLSNTINDAQESSTKVAQEVKDLSGNVSRIDQFAKGITLVVENGETSSEISLTSGGVVITGNTVTFHGVVTFTDLSTSGSTQINGSNITTGTVAADRIDVNNLQVRYLNGASGTFTTLTGTGSINLANTMIIYPNYINANGILIGYLSGYDDICVLPPTATTGNIGVGAMPWDQVVARSVVQTSSATAKTDVKAATKEDTGSIDDIRVVTYRWKEGKRSNVIELGVIAEEMQETNPIFVSLDDDGTPYAVDYGRIGLACVLELQEMRQRVAALENKVAQMKAKEAAEYGDVFSG